MIKNTNIKKFALLMSLIVSLMAFIVVPVIAQEAPVTGVSDSGTSVEQIVSQYEDYDTAIGYLDEYTTNKSSDPDFEKNVEIALDTVKSEIPFYASFWALLPPIIAIGLALITKEVYSSLFIGIVAGGLLAANFNVTHTIDNVVGSGLIDAVSGTAGIFVFLVILGVMVALINKSGGSAAFGRWASKNIKSRVGASIATFVLGILIFIDDYFNCLTVGSIMRPVTDANKISRSKLAYLIDATAAPVCMIAPISSWAAAVASYAEEGQGLGLFIEAIPYNFYSLLTFVFIIGITLLKFDYGPMKKHEANALNGDLFTSGEKVADAEEMEKGNEKGIVLDIIFPIVALIVCCVIALIYNGNGNTFEGMNFIDAFSNTDATVGLPWGAILALIISIIYFAIRKVVSFKESMDSIPKGFKAMVSAILILTMATALKNMTGLLGAKVYVAMLMNDAAALQQFLPAIIFVVACVLAFATGTSWGTFGILIPIVTAIFPDNHALMVIGISACLAGAVCGDHCSPISDTTIMSSAGAQCDHLNHVSTQLPYAITVAAVSFVNFLIAPFIMNVWISLAIAVVMMVAVLFVIKKITVKKEA
ncbi:MAG: Na+/H+ antiporter NhaC family protein [Acutalibacteraceae bacterium]|nr:Na+/H+ antiporter NhaC family protein [Acutalibacteraceae bacterium]